jgi:uncharacterized protein YgiM (DUF1202 family)
MLRTRWIVGLGALALVWGFETARADDGAVMNESAPLRARPGEKAPALLRLAQGQKVKVLERDGRWLKVSVGARTGWVTRTQVVGGDDATTAVATGAATAGQAADAPAETSTRRRKASAAGVGSADAAEPMTAPARKGKWSKLGRTAVGADAVSPAERATRKPLSETGAKATASAAPAKPIAVGSTVAFTARTSVRQRPSARGEELYVADKGEQVKVVLASDEDAGAWLRVLDESGTKGWVEAGSVRVVAAPAPAPAAAAAPVAASGSAAAPTPAPAPVPVTVAQAAPAASAPPATAPRAASRAPAPRAAVKDKEASVSTVADDPAGKPPSRLSYSLDGDVALLERSESFTSQGTGLRANYDLARTAPAIQLGATARYQASRRLEIDGSLAYLRTIGGNTIELPGDPSGAGGMSAVGWDAQALDLRAGLGLRLWGGKVVASARAGYHWQSTSVDQSDVARLPSESVSGLTLGALIEARPLTGKIGAHLGADVLLGGGLSQSDGMRDGDSADLVAYLIHAGVTYQVGRALVAMATYSLTLESVAFSGADQREPTASGGQRHDQQHVLGVGLRFSF